MRPTPTGRNVHGHLKDMFVRPSTSLTDLLANRYVRAAMMKAIVGLAAVAVVTLLVGAPGCKDVGVGDPCVPEQEYFADFNGFSEKEVNVESKSFQCQTR